LEMTEEEYQKNRSYTIDKKVFEMLKSILELVILLLLIHFDYFSRLWNYLFLVIGGTYMPALIYVITDQLRSTVIETPLSYYFNFSIEHKHEFNKMTLNTFVSDKVKSLLIGLLCQIIFFGALIYFMEKYEEKFIITGWLCTMGLISTYMFIYPSYIAPLFNKFESLNKQSEKERQIHCELVNFCSQWNFPLDKIYKIDGSKRSDHSQAYFFGFIGKKQIVIFDTLIEKMSVEEIVAIVGHELGHWYHRHNFKMIGIAYAYIGFTLYLFSLILNNDQMYSDFGFLNKSHFMGLNVFCMLYSPIDVIYQTMLCVLVRWNEYQADRFSVGLGKGKELLSGLIKMFKDNKSELDPDAIVDMLKNTHPNLIDRTEAIRQSIKKNE
jgi:STE24 endopeptidase